jgi:hypothetical protein
MLKKLALAGALCCALATPTLAQSSVAPFAGVQTATLSAAPFPYQTMFYGAVIKADYANTGIIYIGPCATLTTANGYPIKAGEAISYGSFPMSLACMIGTVTTDSVRFTGN